MRNLAAAQGPTASQEKKFGARDALVNDDGFGFSCKWMDKKSCSRRRRSPACETGYATTFGFSKKYGFTVRPSLEQSQMTPCLV